MTNLLDGLRVLDLSLWQPGHAATQLLADLGADVIKVEPPGGDRMRPLVDRFINFNGHKRSAVLDLKRQGDRAAFLSIVCQAEVVVENYRPGVSDRLGVGFEALRAANPSIILCSISGFGQEGPLADWVGHEHNFQAVAGAFTQPPGAEPIPASILVGDQGSGLAGAFAILAAVLCARRTGQPEHIDVSIADLLAAWVAPMGAVDPRREQSRDIQGGRRAPAMGPFQTADGKWVVLGVFSENHFWDALCDALDMRDAVGLSMAQRTADSTELRERVAVAVRAYDRDTLIMTLAARSVPVAPVLSRAEMLQHQHFRHRGLFVSGPDGFLAVTHPIRYRVHPALPPGPAPNLDEHRAEVLVTEVSDGGTPATAV
jgi:crotonobetainyl-CoA:carnitine CoA-transferase CaiB-like acyl-CoA transferase